MAYGRSLPYGPVLDMIRAQFHVEEGDNPLQIQDKLRDGVQRLDPGPRPSCPSWRRSSRCRGPMTLSAISTGLTDGSRPWKRFGRYSSRRARSAP